MAKAIPNPEPRPGGGEELFSALRREGTLSAGGAEAEQLRAENRELRATIAELQQLVEESENQTKQAWVERQAEYESLLEEKSELIRSLHVKLQEFQEKAAAPPLPDEDDLRALAEDVERERVVVQRDRRELDELRHQLTDDEQTMTQQMRQMEVQMARERAEMARQRNELQRLQDELSSELERIARDGGLSEKLGQLRQRYQDVATRKGSVPPSQPPSGTPEAARPPAKKEEPGAKKDSSLFRRLFG